MRRRIWLVLALALTLSVLGIVPRVRGAGDIIPPQVIDTAPARGEELLLDSGVTFYFDQPMDRASVEGALTASTAPTPGQTGQSATPLKGSFSWLNDSTVLFKPTGSLTRDTEYIFSVSSHAQSKAG